MLSGLKEYRQMLKESEGVRGLYEQARWVIGFEMAISDEKPRFVRLAVLQIVAHDLVLPLVCAFVGHDMRDESDATPDSGSVHLSCARCGLTHHARLY